MLRRWNHRREAFTLIELLVVIAIIAVLVGLTSAAVMKGRSAVIRGQNTQQMSQITQAYTTFCGQENMGKTGFLPPAPFRLQNAYNTNDPEAGYLKQLFPNLSISATGLPGTPAAPVVLQDDNQVACFFLTGGAVTNYTGFSNNPQQPFIPGSPGETRKGPFLQLTAKMYSTNPPGKTANGQAWLVDVYGTPYAIFHGGKTGAYRTATGTAQSFSIGTSTVAPYTRAGKFENPTTLQIISAGPDRVFSPGGDWSAITGAAQDDTSNFSPNVLSAGPQ
jgi:prepilin-type N-terminal cleavage/methylation domain-containing protein